MNLKQLKQLISDDSAVSPVIGVILMVAITVILAAVIGTFVLGLGEQTATAPQAGFSFDFTQDNSSDDKAEVVITHESGQSISASQLNVSVDGTTVMDSSTYDYRGSGFSGDVTAGTSVKVYNSTANSQWKEEVIRVTWTSESGSSSATLQKQPAPN